MYMAFLEEARRSIGLVKNEFYILLTIVFRINNRESDTGAHKYFVWLEFIEIHEKPSFKWRTLTISNH